ncbi:MAG: DUF6259 domain-containing protein [Acidobacteriota bacterium]
MAKAKVFAAFLLSGLFPDLPSNPATAALVLEQTPIIVADDRIRATFSPTDGQLVQVENLVTGQRLVIDDPPKGAPIFAYDAGEKGKTRPVPAVVQAFDWTAEGGLTQLHWRLSSPACEVRAAVVVQQGKLQIDVRVEPKGTVIAYPAVSGVSDWGPASRLSVFDHEYRRPCAYLQAPGTAPLGSSQLDVSYYEDGVGGFCTFNRAFEWAPNRSVSVLYDTERQCVGLYFTGQNDYGVTIASMTRGDFVEGAAIYREWAAQQPWCGRGTLRERLKRGEASGWLLQEVGCATFGISSAHDFSVPLRAIAEYAGAPVFHVMGFDWQPGEMVIINGKSRRIYHGSLQSYLPPALNPKNRAAITDTGSYWAGFEFNSFYQMQAQGVAEAVRHAALKTDGKPLSFEDYWVMCSQAPWWVEFHRERDTELVRQGACQANYYDIPMSPTCWSTVHGHQPGSFDAETIYQVTKQSTSQARGQYVPQGTEGMSEYQIDTVDFWQWRSGAWVYGDWDGLAARQDILAEKSVFIPHFEAVYHEFGPIRLDGWANLADEAGDLFYFTSAHTQLAGALLELNYEFQGMDLFPGMGPGDGLMLLYGSGEMALDAAHQYAVSQDKAAFLRQLARLRTDWATDFLAFGRMVSNPAMRDVPAHTYHFYAYNLHNDADDLAGQYRAPAIVAHSWQLDDRFATLLANATEQDLTVTLGFDLPAPRYRFAIRGDNSLDLGWNPGRTSQSITCPARKVLAIIADPPPGRSNRHRWRPR